MLYNLWFICKERGNESVIDVGEVSFPSPDSLPTSHLFKDLEEVLNSHPSHAKSAGNPGKPVIVMEIDDVIFDKWVTKDESVVNNRTPNWKPPQPVRSGQVFPTARALSKHLGFHNNEVAFYLGKVASKDHPNDRVATLRGVNVMYYSDFAAGAK